MTDKERLERVQKLFEQSQSLPVGKRRDFLVSACKNDKSLLDLLNRMLAFASHDTDPLKDVILKTATSVIDKPSLVGTTIDKFELVELIGMGGMGEVYLATRIDNEFEQQVAIKIIRTDVNHKDIENLFQRERQILAKLNHPNICRLLDGGTTMDGQIYLVMEYIEGIPLDKFCKEGQLSLRDKLKLFLQICDGVQAAHQNLVVHCDLKPNNILVTQQGTPILLDFGVANLMSPDLSSVQNASQSIALTYEYASPELLMGMPPALSSDVFSLGILLFELITNSHPNQIRETTLEQVRQFRRAETHTSPKTKIEQDLDGVSRKISIKPLQLIFNKASQFKPKDRYQTVLLFSQDIANYLSHFPISFYKNTVRHQIICWIRRHKLVFASFIIIVSLTIFSGVREVELRNEAEKQVEVSNQVIRFLVDLFRDSDPELNDGKVPDAIALLDKGVEVLSTRLRYKAELAIPLKKNIAISYGSLGQFKKEQKLLENVLKVAQEGGRENTRELAVIYGLLGDNAVNQEQMNDAKRWFRNSMSLFSAMEQPGPDMAVVLSRYGKLQIKLNNYRAALRIFDDAIDLFERYPDIFLNEKMNTLENKALVLGKLEYYEEAVIQYKELLHLKEDNYGKHHPDYLNTLNKLNSIRSVSVMPEQ